MRSKLMRRVCRAIDRFTAVSQPYSDFRSCAKMAKGVGEVDIRCARFAAASGTRQKYVHAVEDLSNRCEHFEGIVFSPTGLELLAESNRNRTDHRF